jgi:hypothetical protein
MKKAAVLSMAMFYLLLTTGMFVCIVHCAADTLTKPSVMVMSAGNNCGHEGMPAHHKSSKTPDCCKQHGEYVIKENIKPNVDLQLTGAYAVLTLIPARIFSTSGKESFIPVWADSNAPPWLSGKSRAILFHSLQI